MEAGTIRIRGQIGVTVRRQPGESWLAAHRRALPALHGLARQQGAAGVLAISTAWLVGDLLRVTACPSYEAPGGAGHKDGPR
jgi:hypothetical protein